MRSKPQRLRPWRPHGLRAKSLNTAQLAHAADVRGELLVDHLAGEEPSAGQRVVLTMLANAVARHASASAWLAGVPQPWINKKSHSAWKLCDDLRREEHHVVRLLQALVDPALERRPREVEDLASYIARRDAEAAALQRNQAVQPASQPDPGQATPQIASGSGLGADLSPSGPEPRESPSPPAGEPLGPRE